MHTKCNFTPSSSNKMPILASRCLFAALGDPEMVTRFANIMGSQLHYIVFHLLVLLTSIPQHTNASISCSHRSSPAKTSIFTIQRSFPPASIALARRYIIPPQLFVLLFSNSISSLRKVTPSVFRVFHSDGKEAVLRVNKVRKNLAVFEIICHAREFFPVSLERSVFVARLRTGAEAPLFELAFRGPNDALGRPLWARNVYARAMVADMVMRARMVLGMHRCSGALADISGYCNNIKRPGYGAVNAVQLRTPSATVTTIFDNVPNPRHISNVLCRSRSDKLAQRKVSFLMVSFGQFIDHDIVLTPSGGNNRVEANIPTSVPTTEKQSHMRFFRSDVLAFPVCCDVSSGIRSTSDRRPFNSISSFIDGSTVYGSDHIRAMGLRTFKHGKLILRKSRGERLLPRNTQEHLLYTVDNAHQRANPDFFVSGDIRANENPVLTAIHTVFAREHNRVSDMLRRALEQRQKPRQSDEWLYQQARRIVVAELQCIVYNEFIPTLLGRHALPLYRGYNATVDASVNLLFSTAAYRWGHSAVRNDILAYKGEGEAARVMLQNAFFNPAKFADEGPEAWLMGAMRTSAMNVDLEHADSIRDFLFNPKKRGVLDLVAINIQRGRDHRLPSYIESREAYGLTGDLRNVPLSTRKKLLNTYGSAKKIDVFIGGLAELKMPRSMLGPLFHRVVAEQFTRLRNGDRFYYENLKWGRFLNSLEVVKKVRSHRYRFMDVIEANTRITKSKIPSRKGAMFTA